MIFWLVAQFLNQLRNHVPQVLTVISYITLMMITTVVEIYR